MASPKLFFPDIKGNPGSSVITILLSPWVSLCLVVGLWVWSLRFFDLNSMKDWGLISIFPISIVIAYLILLTSFSGLFLRDRVSDTIFSLHILLLILMIHGTPQLLYGTLRYSWAWKHVGIVDYIIRHGAVDPQISVLGVYHSWPGFFALNAVFTQLAGFSGAQIYAGWGPVFFETLFALGLRSLFGIFTSSRRLVWLAVWIFLLTNWIAQEYFSPQATAYFMLFGVLILVLLGFGPAKPLKFDSLESWFSSRNHYLAKVVRNFVGWLSGLRVTNVPIEAKDVKTHDLGLRVLILVCFFTIVSSHQLTPNMGVAAFLVLVLFGYTRWKTLPIWTGILIALWLLFPAKAYRGEAVQSVFDSYGQVASNIDSGLIDVAVVSSGQALVSWMGRGLTVLIGVLAGVGVYQRVRHRYLDLPVISLAAAPILAVLITSYGGEAVFRVYFFAIPYLSFLAAGAFLPDEQSGRRGPQAWWIGGVSVVLLVGFLFAYYGKEQQYYFTNSEVEAAEYLYGNAVPNSLLIEGSRNYPSQFLNYEYFTYVPLDRESVEDRFDFLYNPVAVFYRWMSNPDYAASYLLITRSQKISTDTLGTLPPGALENIQTDLERSDVFEIIFSNQDAIIFKIRPGE